MNEIKMFFKSRITILTMLAVIFLTAQAARADKLGYEIKSAKVTSRTLSNFPSLTVTIANNSFSLPALTKESRARVKVEIYAFPTKCAVIGNQSAFNEYYSDVAKGKITPFDLPLSDCYQSKADVLAMGLAGVWATSPQQVQVSAQSSKDFVFEFPPFWKTPKSDNPVADKLHKFIRIFQAADGTYYGTPPKFYTFDQSVFLILVGNDALAYSKTITVDKPDDVFYFDPNAKK